MNALRLSPDHVLHRVQRGALVAGVAALALCAAGAFVSPQQFFRSYLVAYLFWFGIALGCMAILMIHHIAGGAWGAVIRRVLESGTRTLPLLAILFVPLLLGLSSLYEWARPEAVAHDPVLQYKAAYLNVPFFVLRTVFYFAVWLAFTIFLNRWSLQQDASPDPVFGARLEMISRGGLVGVGLTMTFASIDWVMSLEPHWYSTIYGILVMGGQVLAAMAFVIPVTALLAQGETPSGAAGPLAGIAGAEQFHDLGKLMLAFVMVWAYFAFSQFLIVWSANLPEEIPWYLHRMQGGWQFVALGIIVFHFALPFAVLLSRDVKRRAGAVALVALAVMLLRFVDLFWLVTPAFHPAGFAFHWMDLMTLIGIGGVWVWTFVAQLQTRPLIARNDPSLPQQAPA